MDLRVTLGNARKRRVNDLRIQHQQMAPNVAPSSERLAIHYSIRESFLTSVVRTRAGTAEAILQRNYQANPFFPLAKKALPEDSRCGGGRLTQR